MSELDFEKSVPTDDEDIQAQKLVPVSESIRYRKRAQVAEKKIEDLENELKANKSQAEQFAQQLQQLHTEQELAAKLIVAGASDLDGAILIAKSRLSQKGNADIDEVIENLKKEKEYLFPNSSGGNQFIKTAGAKEKLSGGTSVIERAAKKAAVSGNRTDLLEYLKLRRKFL